MLYLIVEHYVSGQLTIQRDAGIGRAVFNISVTAL